MPKTFAVMTSLTFVAGAAAYAGTPAVRGGEVPKEFQCGVAFFRGPGPGARFAVTSADRPGPVIRAHRDFKESRDLSTVMRNNKRLSVRRLSGGKDVLIPGWLRAESGMDHPKPDFAVRDRRFDANAVS
jgi:hypothetical protein